MSQQSFEPKPPRRLHTITELPRSMGEMTALLAAWPLFTHLPDGDGHPIMVLPGFAAGDESTWLLRRFLEERRYQSIPWRLGTNTGALELQEKMVRRLYRLIRIYRQPITLIGHSLGGVFAREMARRFPQHIRQVITMGSPFGATSHESTDPTVLKLFEQMSGLAMSDLRENMPGGEDPLEPVGVPCTAIYSRSDGVVQWRTCLENESEHAENIEVIASHCGMAMNPAVFVILSDRLRQDPDDWQKFDTNTFLNPL